MKISHKYPLSLFFCGLFLLMGFPHIYLIAESFFFHKYILDDWAMHLFVLSISWGTSLGWFLKKDIARKSSLFITGFLITFLTFFWLLWIIQEQDAHDFVEGLISMPAIVGGLIVIWLLCTNLKVKQLTNPTLYEADEKEVKDTINWDDDDNILDS